MFDGLRIGNVEWNVYGYTLVDYARQMEVRMMFHAAGTEVQISPNFRLMVDGKEYSPSSMRVVYEYASRKQTYTSERAVEQVEVLQNGYLPLRIMFATPASCLRSETERDACMRGKKISIRWVQYNVADAVMFRENWD